MASSLAIQSVAGAVTGQLLSVLIDVLKTSFAFKGTCKLLKDNLEGIIPALADDLNSGVELSPNSEKALREFDQKLRKGIELVKKCSKVNRLNILKSYRYAKKIEKLDLYVVKFIQTRGFAHLCSKLHVSSLHLNNFGDIQHEMVDRLENYRHEMVNRLENIQQTVEARKEESESKFITDQMGLLEIFEKTSQLSIPELPDFQVGLKSLVHELKERLLGNDVSLLGVKGMGGSGKTTLATALCNDPQVKVHFQERIVFVRVSPSPNLKGLLERMWGKIVGGKTPDFHDIEDAHTQLQQRLRQMEPYPTLVVLDDVWQIDHLEKLLFNGKGYKTLLTTRNNNVVKSDDYRYEIPCLREPDAVSLFCFSAFDQKSIPEKADCNIVKEVIEECKGLPLALKVIGRSLYDQPPEAWITAKDKLSKGQPINDYHQTELLKRMATSIDMLEEKVQECFLDMGIFPEARKISADPLLDLGVYVHKLQWAEVYTILIELASRNLVNLVNNRKWTVNSYGSSCELAFIQHDMLRDMAIYLTRQGPIINRRKRLIMSQKADSIPKTWKKAAKSAFDAEIVSFHTGSMEKKDWCQMDFPNAKALILNFSASEYFLPPFMESMPKLKVLMIVNHNSKRATLKGISVFSSLTRLKVVRLERVIVSPLRDYGQSWQKLKKLSFILCEGFGNMSRLHLGLDLYFPHLSEITIDHCSNLEELPVSVRNMPSLQRLSITNCHDLLKLSDDIGNLSSLQMLRLYACLSLEKLPYSICNLRQLQFLDISLCGCIKQLPDELGRLSSLKEIDMRECSRVKQLPKSASDLRSLVHVICDEKIGHQWSEIKASTNPRLRVEVAEEEFNLGWLDD